jgi:hypothetical protein
MLQSTRAISDGRLLDAQSCIERMREAAQIAGGLNTVWLYCQLLLLEAQDNRELLEQVVKHSDVAMIERLAPQHALGAFARSAALAARLGQTSAARVFLARAMSFDIARLPMTQGDLGVLCKLAEAHASLHDASCADALYAQLLPYADRNAVGIALEYHGSVAHFLGVLALLRGENEAAQQHLQQAISFNKKLPNPAFAARSQELLDETRSR